MSFLALAKTLAIPATDDKTPAPVAKIARTTRNAEVECNLTSKSPDTDAFEERAAIAEFDGGLSRPEAEALAARQQGYDNVVAFRAAFKGEDQT